MNLRIGTSGYGYKEWKGLFYPEKFSDKKMLSFYAQHFPTVESNYTFRAMPTVELLHNWANEVPADFQFALKAPQRITHSKRLNDCGDLVEEFLAVARTLGKRMGPLFFQLPPNMKKDTERLAAFLKLIPKKTRVAFEFRNQTWFDDDVFTLLRSRNAAMCLAEAENDLEVPFIATADWGYVRMRCEGYTLAELKERYDRITSQPWDDVYVYFRHEDEAKGPVMAQQMIEMDVPKPDAKSAKPVAKTASKKK